MEIETSQTTAEQLKEKLLAEHKEREDNCASEIAEILKKYNCSIDTRVILERGQVIPDILIKAND